MSFKHSVGLRDGACHQAWRPDDWPLVTEREHQLPQSSSAPRTHSAVRASAQTHSQRTQVNKYNRIQLLKLSSRLLVNWRHEKVSAWLERKASADLEGLCLVIFHNKYLFKTNSLARRGPFIKIINLAWIKKSAIPLINITLLKVYFSQVVSGILLKKILHSIKLLHFLLNQKLVSKIFIYLEF